MDPATKERVSKAALARGSVRPSADDYLLDVLNRVVKLDLPEPLASDALEARDRLDVSLTFAERQPSAVG